MNIIEKLKEWWEGIKPVVLAGVLAKLDTLKAPLADRLKDIEGTPEQQADTIIEWIKNYLKKQL
jgi:hypothetical protein